MKLKASKSNLFISLISSILVCSFILAPVSVALTVNRAQAAVPSTIVGDVSPTGILNSINTGKITVESTISTASGLVRTAFMSSLNIKEFSLDAIAWALVNIMVKAMIKSTTQWVSSGFQGSPSFVTDLGAFLTDIGDQVAGDIIYGSGLDMLCSPFKLNVKLALDIQYRQSRKGHEAQCRLSGVVNNMERFLDGDFSEGGWNGWFQVATQNNPYNEVLDAQAALAVGISNTKGKKLQSLSFGSGFFGKQECKSVPNSSEAGGPAMTQVCTDTTPGKVIETQLNHSLGLPGSRLAVADELNELMGALMSQLASAAMSEVGGLLGMNRGGSNGGGNGGGSYFDRMSRESTPQSQQSTGVSENPFTESLSGENSYRAQQQQIITLITSAQTFISTYEDTYNTTCYASSALTPSLSQYLNNASLAVASSTAIVAHIQELNTDNTRLSTQTTPPAIISTLLTKYSAPTVEEARLNLMNQFMGYRASGEIHTEEQGMRIRLETLPTITTEVDTYRTNFVSSCNQSNSQQGRFRVQDPGI